MSNSNTKKLINLSVDYILFPLFIILLAYHPYYKHGLFLSWDEGSPLSWVNAIQFHQLPLKDFFVTFGPLFPYLSALALKICGNTVAGFRSFMFFGSLASMVAVYFLGRQLIKSRILLLMLCWFITSACFIPFWMSKWGGIRCLAMVIPVLILFRALRSKAPLAIIWFGLVSGVCSLVTQEAGIISMVMFTVYLCLAQSKRLKDAATFSISFLSIVGVFYLYLVLRGASMEMILLNTLKSPFAFFDYYNNPPRLVLLPFLRPFNVSAGAWLACLQSASFDFVFSCLVYACAIAYSFINRKRQDSTFLIIMVFGITLFIIGMRGFTGPVVSGPQFHWGLIGSGIIGFYFAQKLIFPIKRSGAGEGARALAKKSVCLLILFFGLIFSKLTPDYIAYMYARFKDVELPAVSDFKLERLGDARLPEAQARTFFEVSRLIMSCTGENEAIYAFPHEPQYYFLAKRRCVDIFTNALDVGFSTELQEESLSRIAAQGLKYAVMVRDSYRVMSNRQVPNEERIPLIYRYFEDKFFTVADINGTLVLKRK